MMLKLKKKTSNAKKTLSNKMKNSIPFKKSKIVIFDDLSKKIVQNDDSDDDTPINTNKLSSIIKEKFNGQTLKKSVASNANLVREMLMKTVDKHKVEICGQMAQQIVEIYNKRQEEEEDIDKKDYKD
jgi:hypothetical protein